MANWPFLEEWRKQRWVLAASVAGAMVALVVAVFEKPNPLDTGSTLHRALLWIGWPILAAAAGALTFRRDKKDSAPTGAQGALQCLLRWTLKSMTASLVLLLSGLILFSVGRFTSWDFPRTLTLESIRSYYDYYPSKSDIPVSAIAPVLTFLSFACSLFLSVVSGTSLASAAVGLTTAVLIVEASPCAGRLVDFYTPQNPFFASDLPTLLGAVILVVSLAFSLKVKSPSRQGAFASIVRAVLLVGCITIGAFISSTYVLAHVAEPDARLHDPLMSADGSVVLGLVENRLSEYLQVWAIPLDGSPVRRLTGRLAYYVGATPTSRSGWLGYLAQRSWLGLRKPKADLRAVRLDGSGDHVVVPALLFGDGPRMAEEVLIKGFSFSPDGTRIAFISGRSLIVTTIDGRKLLDHEFTADVEGHEHYVRGWTQDGKEVLVEAPLSLEAWDPITGKIRVLTPSGRFRAPLDAPAGIRYIVLDNHLVDINAGATEALATTICEAPSFSDDQQVLLYAVEHNNNVSTKAELHWRECQTGRDKVMATVGGRPAAMFVSPDRQKLIVSYLVCDRERNPYAPCTKRNNVIGLDGSIKSLQDDWVAIAWRDDQNVMFKKKVGGEWTLASVDVTSGHLRVIFPREGP